MPSCFSYFIKIKKTQKEKDHTSTIENPDDR